MATSTINITPKLEKNNNISTCRFGNMGIIAGAFTGNGTNTVSIGVSGGGNNPCLVRNNSTGDMAICYLSDGNIKAYKSTLPNQIFANNDVYDFIGVLD